MVDAVRRRILIADDDRRLRSMLVMFFQLEGYDVDEAGSAEEVYKQLTGPSYDLVLTDSFGVEAARVLEAGHALTDAAWPVPVVLFTGHHVARDAALLAGFADVLSKPIDLVELLNHVELLMA